jgi:hypothetical protein
MVYWLGSLALQIKSDTIITGIDGWADTRCGDYYGSKVSISDDNFIHELNAIRWLDMYGGAIARMQLAKQKMKWADRDARNLARKLAKIPDYIKRVIIATHVPPFEESCLYEGRQSGEHYIPFFCSKVLGETISKIAAENPNVMFEVYSGHTHGECSYQKTHNLKVNVAGAEYGYPKIQRVIEY